tara:strand:- start:16074 stop:17120 length:1047 start_codon:yes stop_codon:yes gene_type:complete
LTTSFLSFFYRSIRLITTKVIYSFQKFFFIPLDLESAVNFGDKSLVIITTSIPYVFNYQIPKNIEVELFDLKFPSPLTAASFKSEIKILDFWLNLGLGSITFKTIKKEERSGNKRPRLQEIKSNGHSGLLNSMGLPGPGIEKFIDEISNSKIWEYGRPLGISIGGDSPEEYIFNIKKLIKGLREKNNYFIEINISCPNTDTGKSLADDLENLNTVLNAVRKITSQVIGVKVSPDSEFKSLSIIGEIVGDYPKIFINAGNTQYKTINEVGINKKDFSMPGGGLSGPMIFPKIIEMVQLFKRMELPIMATGGISSIDHVKAVKDEGAILFGMATSLVMDPFCIPRINRKL